MVLATHHQLQVRLKKEYSYTATPLLCHRSLFYVKFYLYLFAIVIPLEKLTSYFTDERHVPKRAMRIFPRTRIVPLNMSFLSTSPAVDTLLNSLSKESLSFWHP